MAFAVRRDRMRRERLIEAGYLRGFEYVGGNLEFNGIARVPVERLRELCFPDDIEDPERRREAVAEGRKLFKSKPWFHAQSVFYDLRLHHMQVMKTRRGLRYDLGEMIKMGKCDTVGEQASALEKAFKEDERVRRDHKLIFSELKDPSEKAAWDIDLFKDHYFLTDDKPDPTITPEPLVLNEIDPVLMWELPSMVLEIDGLDIARGDRDGQHFVVIGWEATDITAKVLEIEASFIAGQNRKKSDPWRLAMEMHDDYLWGCVEAAENQLEGDEGTTSDQELREMQLDDAIGTYIIKCPSISMSSEFGPVFFLDINDHPSREGDDGILIADMSFGIIEGTMLLSFSKETLNMTSKIRLDEDTDDELDNLSDGGDIEEYDIYNLPMEEVCGEDVAEPSASKPGKRSAPDSGAKMQPSRAAKKRKQNTRQLIGGRRRLYFVWGGRDTDEGEPFENQGYLDFNDTCTQFKGITWIETLEMTQPSGECRFDGFKVGGKSLTLERLHAGVLEAIAGDRMVEDRIFSWVHLNSEDMAGLEMDDGEDSDDSYGSL